MTAQCREDTVTDDDERRAYRESTAGARPLKPDNRVPLSSPRPRPRARRRRAEEASVLQDSLRPQWLEGQHGEVWYARPGLPDRTVRNLRDGRYAVEAELDLHGMRRDTARGALKSFLAECGNCGIGCVRIVHGMGHRSGPAGPILKHAVQDWLTQWDDVLGFASAGPRRGGNGAVVALLRRR
ncbi:MAG: Smr/MutS family protein, partial [Gammaproteobacteria bacterium]|jgi:DNA-nicking Smr family endonuclease